MIVFDGFVHKRTEVKVMELDFGTKYEFYALIFDADLIGFKVNFPEKFDKLVNIDHRIRITMDPVADTKAWFVVRETDNVEDLGSSEIADPYKEYTFQAGYVSNPSKGIVTVHFPKEIENIDVVWVPVDLIEDIDESMYSIWKVRAMKVVHAVTVDQGIRYTLTVKEVLETVPMSESIIYERPLKDIRYDQKGIYVKIILREMRRDRNGIRIQIPSEEIFILNKNLPFRSRERLNIRKKDLVGRIQISVKYRLTGRWNVHKSTDETKWIRIGIEKIELTDQVALMQIKRFSVDEENLRSPEQKL